MALADIIKLIEREASEKATSLVESAEAEAKKIISASEKKAKKEMASYEEDKQRERDVIKKRKTSELLRKEKIAISMTQQEIVDSIFESVKNELENLSGEDLVNVFVSFLKKIDADKGKVVVLGGKKSEMEEALKLAKKDFSISECSECSGGGFIFEGDEFEMDFSFSYLVEKELRPAEEGNIFKELFS